MHINIISRYIFIFIDTSEKIIILEREPIIDTITFFESMEDKLFKLCKLTMKKKYMLTLFS